MIKLRSNVSIRIKDAAKDLKYGKLLSNCNSS